MDQCLKAGCFKVAAPPAKRTSDIITVSVVCYQRLDLTRRCLDMLLASAPECDVIVTNNASTDGTAEYLDEFAALHDNVVVVHNPENRGYKDPHNDAFFAAAGRANPPKFVCILNNDMELSPGWLEQVRRAFDKNPLVAIVGSARGACSRLSEDFHGGPAAAGQEHEYVEGSMLIIRTEIGREFGLFSPKLEFIYGEDSDLSLRVRERGYQIRLLDLPCRHLANQTIRTIDPETGAKIRQCQERNHVYLRTRWAPYMKRRSFNYTVLVRRSGALGDIIDTTPVIAAIKRKWPMSRIHVASGAPEVFYGNPHVALYGNAFPNNEFDYSFDLDLAYEKRPMEHTLKCYADVCEVDCPLETARLELYLTESDKRTAARLLPRSTKERWICVHAGPSHWPGKHWPNDRWLGLIRRLRSDGWSICLVGHGGGSPPAGVSVDLRNRTSVQELCAVMQRCEAFVGIDSGPSHVAQAAGLPAVILFGTVLPEYKVFRTSKVIAVQADRNLVPCVGEHHRMPPPVIFSTCAGECMAAITVDMVLTAINNL